MFYPKDVNERATEQAISTRYQGVLEDYVAGAWYENHYRAERGWPLLSGRQFAVVTEHDLATDDERRRLPHYNDLYLRWGFSGFAAIGFKVGTENWCLPLLKTVDQGFFSKQEADRLLALGPHLRRMIQLSEQYAPVCAAGGIEALEGLGRPAMLIDWAGRLIEMNGLAEGLLADPGNFLVVRNGRLHACHAASNLRLQAMLDGAGTDGGPRAGLYFASDGQAHMYWKGEPWTTTWSTRDGAFCYQHSSGDRCWALYEKDGTIYSRSLWQSEHSDPYSWDPAKETRRGRHIP